MSAKHWYRRWIYASQHFAIVACHVLSAMPMHGDRERGEVALRRARRWARLALRAQGRADEAMARMSLLRADGGAT